MIKEYQYQKHIRWSQYIIFILCGILAILAFFVMPFFSFIFVLEGVLIWYFLRYMAGIRILLDDDYIVYKYRRGEKRIRFDDISSLKFSSIPYLGGWIKIISKNDTIRLTVVVKNIGDLLQELKIALDKRKRSDCYDEKKFFSFLKTAAYSDQSWARLYEIFWKFVLITIIVVLISFLFSFGFVILGRCDPSTAALMVIISTFYPMVVYIFTEIIFGRRIAKDSNEELFTYPSRDMVYERSIYRKVILYGILFYFIFLIMIILF